jgi:hypothetical protein
VVETAENERLRDALTQIVREELAACQKTAVDEIERLRDALREELAACQKTTVDEIERDALTQIAELTETLQNDCFEVQNGVPEFCRAVLVTRGRLRLDDFA